MNRRMLFIGVMLLTVASALAIAQNTTLVYKPDVQIGAAGAVSFLEERVDGELVKRAEFAAPGVCVDFIQKRNSDGSLRRLVWFFDGDPGSDEYTIEEQNAQPDGTWSVSGILNYSGGELVKASFYSGENLIEERLYEYGPEGVTKELTTRASEEYPTLLDFERPGDDIVEAFERQPDGGRLLVARLIYDDEGRLTTEERFLKGKLDRRDVFAYNDAGKVIDHIRYDNRELPIRHVIYDYTKDGLPQSVVHKDVKDRILFGVSYTREYDGENTKTIIKNSAGDETGSIEYRRENGRDVMRTETFLLGSGKLEIVYTDFDEQGNWLRKEMSTYNSGALKSRSVTSRVIRYFEK
jgi:antitoxin component YwqK of YwqJK toxin-antitoxin module